MLRSLVWFLPVILTNASVAEICPGCSSINFFTPRYGFGGLDKSQYLELWFSDTTGCSPLSIPPSNSSRCVVIPAMGCSPAHKAKLAQDAGAEALVIISDAPGATVYLSGRIGATPKISIPVYAASSGEILGLKQMFQKEYLGSDNQSAAIFVRLSASPNPWESVVKFSLVWRILFPVFATVNATAAFFRLQYSKGFFPRLFLCLELVANSGRVFAFSIDPYGWNGLLPNFAVSFLMGFPYSGAVLSSIVLAIYFRKLRVSVNLVCIKRALVFWVLVLELFFICSIIATTIYHHQFRAQVVEQLIYSVLELLIALWFIWEGVAIHRALTKSGKVTDEPGLRTLTRKLASRLTMTVFSMCLYSFLCLSALLVSTPLNYICMVTIGQTAYFGISAVQISFFSSSKPRMKSRKVAEGARTADAKPEKVDPNKDVKRRILLLGTGASGKSTIFKQAKLIYGGGYTDEERLMFRISIDKTVITSIKRLCQESRYYSPIGKSELWQSAVFVCGLQDDERVTSDIARHIRLLWISDPIQKTYHQHRHKFQLPADNLQHFFNRIDVIADPHYLPTVTDILYCRIPSASVRSMVFNYNGEKFMLTDVGGQRSERKKWKQCMEGVEEVLFVVALSEYNQLLFEDHYTNRLQDAFDVCAELLNSGVPSKVHFSLLLNKVDLFHKKVFHKKMDVPLPSAPPNISGDTLATAQWIYDQLRKSRPSSRCGLWADYTIATDSTDIKRVLDERLSRLFHSKKSTEVERPEPQYPSRLFENDSAEPHSKIETDNVSLLPGTTISTAINTHTNNSHVIGCTAKPSTSLDSQVEVVKAIAEAEVKAVTTIQHALPTKLALSEQVIVNILAPSPTHPDSPLTTAAELQRLVPTTIELSPLATVGTGKREVSSALPESEPAIALPSSNTE